MLVSSQQQPLRHFRVRVDHVPELDLLLAEIFLLYEEVDGVALAEEGGLQGAVLHVAGDRPDYKLLDGGPARVRGGVARHEPVLALAVLVSQRHQGIVLVIIQAGLDHWDWSRWRQTTAARRPPYCAAAGGSAPGTESGAPASSPPARPASWQFDCRKF